MLNVKFFFELWAYFENSWHLYMKPYSMTMLTRSLKKACICCGDEVLGRADKKFCSVDCRAMYNNARNRDKNNLMRNINRILRQNRVILQRFYSNGKTKVHRELLRDHGFEFSYFTNVYKTHSGKVYNFCYEQGILQLNENYFTIVQRHECID